MAGFYKPGVREQQRMRRRYSVFDLGIATTPFAWNPADAGVGIVLSNANLTASSTAGWRSVRATASRNSGKWYAEGTLTSSSARSSMLGLCTATHALSNFCGSAADGWSIQGKGDSVGFIRTWNNNTLTSQGTSVATGGIVRVAVDFDAGKIWFGRVGDWLGGGGDPATGTSPAYTFTPNTTLYLAESNFTSTESLTLNAGGSAFAGTVPSGYLGWS